MHAIERRAVAQLQHTSSWLPRNSCWVVSKRQADFPFSSPTCMSPLSHTHFCGPKLLTNSFLRGHQQRLSRHHQVASLPSIALMHMVDAHPGPTRVTAYAIKHPELASCMISLCTITQSLSCWDAWRCCVCIWLVASSLAATLHILRTDFLIC